MLKIASWFSSIGLKLFIYFWLIIILTVGATRIVSEQFRPKSYIVPNHHGDINKLERIDKLISRRSPATPQALLKILPKRMKSELLIKSIASEKITYSQAPHIEKLADFLNDNNLDSLTTIKFEFSRMTGPKKIEINKIPYQIFIVSRDKKFRMGGFMVALPAWFRISIPILISSIFLWFLTRSFTKPLVAMQRTAARFGDGELTARVPLTAQRNDEIGACAVSFNLMAEKLEQNIGSHQRLMADVSHELRSPMTRLQIALGLAQQEEISTHVLKKHLQRCELEVSRLDEMITSVLSLSRMENIISQMELMSVDIKELLALCIKDAQYMANEKLIAITFQSDDVSLTQADPNLLASAFNNILINAVKYSPNNSELKVYLTQSNRHFMISIVDMGIGVPAESLSKLFEPFYRVTQARDRATGGTGLGLAIAKQAIVAHHGNIKAKNNKNNGLTVSIELPIVISKNSL